MHRPSGDEEFAPCFSAMRQVPRQPRAPAVTSDRPSDVQPCALARRADVAPPTRQRAPDSARVTDRTTPDTASPRHAGDASCVELFTPRPAASSCCAHRRSMRPSITGRKWAMRPWIGQAAASPARRSCGPRSARDVEQHVDLALLGAAFDHAGEHAPHPARALAAGRALAAALMLVEIRQAGDGADDVGGLVHDDDRRRAEPRARLAGCRNPSACR